MVLDRQESIVVNIGALRAYLGRIKRALGLESKEFNVCLTDDRTMRQLNGAHRGKRSPTDVLAFPWGGAAGGFPRRHPARKEFADFLGDIVISLETARRNARREGHSVERETEWLMLHGVLHLLGFDHETDRGEMASLELALRQRLDPRGGYAGRARPGTARPLRRPR